MATKTIKGGAQAAAAKPTDEPDEATRKELEQRYMALKMIDAQIKQTQKQMELIEQQSGELVNTIEALDDLSKVAPGTEILVPLASGVFAKATITDTSRLIVNVGANTSVTKTISDVKNIVEQQSIEIRKIEEELSSQIQALAGQAQAIEQDMPRLIG